MPGHRVTHDLDEDPVVHDGQVLGDESPLEFENGVAVLDDEETARNLARRHTHVEYAGRVYEDDDADDVDEEFDASGFVDRTPMSEVVEDIESGDHDDHLDAIEAAEEADRDRDGVKDAVDDRREE